MERYGKAVLLVVCILVLLSSLACSFVVPGVTTNDGRPCYSSSGGCTVPTLYPTNDLPTLTPWTPEE